MSLTLEQIQDFKGKYPRQIWSLFFSEMWERFCFYGMRGCWCFYDTPAKFCRSAGKLTIWCHTGICICVYICRRTFADKILGFRKSLFWGGSLMIVGSILLAIDPHKFFFFGLAFIIIGTGFSNQIFLRW